MAQIDQSDILKAAARFMDESADNRLAADIALRPDLAGLRFFEPPLMGVADARDPLFVQLQAIEAVGPMFMPPDAWLPGARSVISFFLPFTDRIISANQGLGEEIPPEWLHGRIEGQAALNAMILSIQKLLIESGYVAMIPSMDERFQSGPKEVDGRAEFTSTWSERHVASASGLGTFGLSRGLITEKGMAGRFGSIVTDMPLTPNPRPYTRYDEYCTYCGECAARCPVQAIDVHKGKNMSVCNAFQQKTREKYAPRYGCGKCSIGVQCTSRIP
ncbi:MAG: 4Fe-4S binding protein [Clostridiales bacterium]|nr:4Fe-4S binding protein [Clostridiales bacterium]